MAGPGAAAERVAYKSGPKFRPKHAVDHGQQTLRKQGVTNGFLHFSPGQSVRKKLFDLSY
jgi:hypothetical protein